MRYQWLVPRCPAVNVRPDAVILFIANALRTTRAGGDEKNGQHSEQRRDGPRFTWRASGSNPVSCGRHEPISTSFPALVPFASPPWGQVPFASPPRSSPFCGPPSDQVPFASPPPKTILGREAAQDPRGEHIARVTLKCHKAFVIWALCRGGPWMSPFGLTKQKRDIKRWSLDVTFRTY